MIKYYNKQLKKQTFKYIDDETTIISTDPRVSCFWEILEQGEEIEFDSDNLPVKVKYELKEDGTKYDYYLPLENGVYRPDLDKQNEQEQIILHEQKSNEVNAYVNSLVITTASGRLFKANYSALTSMDIILKGDYPDGTIPIWKQNIEGQLVYYEDVPLSELSEVRVEANKRIQAKHAEVFLNRPNPYND